jgi:cytochrome oxidase Cu insertion factor (SCO1/SenC/PrrC family)
MTATVVPMARAAVLAAAGLVLAACSASPTTTGDAAETDAPSAAAAGPETRQVILDLALPTYDGGQFDPDTLKAKPVILWFWGAF